VAMVMAMASLKNSVLRTVGSPEANQAIF